MPEKFRITLTTMGLAREISRMFPVMRARRRITNSTDDFGLACALAEQLVLGFTITRMVDPQYEDIVTRELGRDGFTRG